MDQFSIAHGMTQKSRELQDYGEGLRHWQQSMKADEERRRAQNEENDRQQAILEKDAKQFKMYKTEGNNCFKADRFEDAIAWYDKAMAAANSQAEISVLYCNRAQCQLKLKDYAEALKSCNKAVELNAKNEKAMYRSMLAHSYLGQLDEAIRAGERTLQMNPRNEPAIKCLEELRQRVKKDSVKRIYTSTLDGLGEDVPYITKPPHLQSRVPLRRIPVVSTRPIAAVVEAPIRIEPPPPADEPMTPVIPVVKSPPSTTHDRNNDIDDKAADEQLPTEIDCSFIEKADHSPEVSDKSVPNSPQSSSSSSTALRKSNKELENTAIKSDDVVRPTSSTEFYREWKSRSSPTARYSYLKLIPAADLNRCIGSQLDSNLLSELLQVLAVDFVRNDTPPMDYVVELAKNRELSILAMMMGADDRKALETIIAYTNRRHDATLKTISKAFTI